jgi:hypothetical protein
MSTVGPLGGGVGDPRAPTINLKTATAGPLEGGAVDLGAPTINAKKHQWWGPWEAMLEIQERPPATLKIIDGGPPMRQW